MAGPPFQKPPRGLLRLVLRLPVWLYRLRMGWVLGSRFALVEHTGRRSGAPRRVVLEVIGRDAASSAYYVAAAWGDNAQWLRNVRTHPDVELVVGRRRLTAQAGRVPVDEAERVFSAYTREHRIAMSALGWLLGTRDPRTLAETVPVVALRPA